MSAQPVLDDVLPTIAGGMPPRGTDPPGKQLLTLSPTSLGTACARADRERWRLRGLPTSPDPLAEEVSGPETWTAGAVVVRHRWRAGAPLRGVSSVPPAIGLGATGLTSGRAGDTCTPCAEAWRVGAVDSSLAAQPRASATWVAPAWEQIVRDHSARVYRLAHRLSGNTQDAEDLTQETFIRVFRSLASFSPGTFEGWLHRITTHLFLDMVRRRKRIRFDALPDDTERLPGTAPSPDQVYAETHLDPEVQAALDALSPEYRAAVVLCDIEGLTYEDIADVLGIKMGTVRSRIHRGRVQLRRALSHLAPTRAVVAGGSH
jgi:RNA polymerase sigma factor (sigma-70 family)